MPVTESGSEQGLVRAIGVRGLTANIVNATIGAGIFVLPALVAAGSRRRGTPRLSRLRARDDVRGRVVRHGRQPRVAHRRHLRLRRGGVRSVHRLPDRVSRVAVQPAGRGWRRQRPGGLGHPQRAGVRTTGAQGSRPWSRVRDAGLGEHAGRGDGRAPGRTRDRGEAAAAPADHGGRDCVGDDRSISRSSGRRRTGLARRR